MTLNDLERQNRGFMGFFGDFGLRHKSRPISFTVWLHATIVMQYRITDREFGICILT